MFLTSSAIIALQVATKTNWNYYFGIKTEMSFFHSRHVLKYHIYLRWQFVQLQPNWDERPSIFNLYSSVRSILYLELKSPSWFLKWKGTRNKFFVHRSVHYHVYQYVQCVTNKIDMSMIGFTGNPGNFIWFCHAVRSKQNFEFGFSC
jgi:hypothetical protein